MKTRTLCLLAVLCTNALVALVPNTAAHGCVPTDASCGPCLDDTGSHAHFDHNLNFRCVSFDPVGDVNNLIEAKFWLKHANLAMLFMSFITLA